MIFQPNGDYPLNFVSHPKGSLQLNALAHNVGWRDLFLRRLILKNLSPLFATINRNEFGLWLVVKSFPQNTSEPFLPFWYPCAVMLADHVLGVAEKLRNVPDGDARLLQEDARKRMPETMRRRLDLPRAA